MKKFFFLLAIIAMVGSSFFGQHLLNAMAEEKGMRDYKKYYTSIRIEDGDTLWSIAKRYEKHSGKTTEDYIRELKTINLLGGDIIHAGGYLTISYYAEEPLPSQKE